MGVIDMAISKFLDSLAEVEGYRSRAFPELSQCRS